MEIEYITIGASATSATSGDFVSGDGTNELFWDASSGILQLRTTRKWEIISTGHLNPSAAPIWSIGTDQVQWDLALCRCASNTLMRNGCQCGGQ